MSLTEEQLKIRRLGIGGSESAALVGLHPFLTLHDVFRAKTDSTYSVAITAPMERGMYLEEGVAKWYAARTGASCSEVGTLRHPAFERILCTPDRIAKTPSGDMLDVSIKVPGPWAQEHWGQPGGDDVPDYVLIQAQWELIVLEARYGIRHCHVVAPIGQDLAIYNVSSDAEIQGQLIEAAHKFWQDHVQTGTPPPVDGSESSSALLKARFPRAQQHLAIATAEADALMLKLKTVRVERKQAELEEELVVQSLQQMIGECEGMRGQGWRISWKNVKDGVKTDWEAAAREAGVPEHIIQKHTRPKSGGRRFLPTWEESK